MAFFDELRERASDLGRAGVAKSKQLAEITKLSINNASEEDTIKKAYIEMGRLYYAERGLAPEAAYEGLCAKVTAAKANIEENKMRIAQLKADDNGFADFDEPAAPVDTQAAPEEPDCTAADFADTKTAADEPVVEPLAEDKPET